MFIPDHCCSDVFAKIAVRLAVTSWGYLGPVANLFAGLASARVPGVEQTCPSLLAACPSDRSLPTPFPLLAPLSHRGSLLQHELEKGDCPLSPCVSVPPQHL